MNFSSLGKSSAKEPNMTFTAEDYEGISYPHDDPLVVSLDIANHTVHRILVDGGSAANILFREAFDAMKLDKKYLIPVNYPVIGFNGSSSIPDGIFFLSTTFGNSKAAKNIMAEFLVINVPSV